MTKEIAIVEHNQIEQEARRSNGTQVLVYSDGSEIQNKVAFTATSDMTKRDHCVKYMGTSTRTGVYAAELCDIWAGMMLSANVRNMQTIWPSRLKEVVVFADNQGAVQAARNLHCRAAQYLLQRIWSADTLMHEAGIVCKIRWCPGYCAVAGNERADELAKHAALNKVLPCLN